MENFHMILLIDVLSNCVCLSFLDVHESKQKARAVPPSNNVLEIKNHKRIFKGGGDGSTFVLKEKWKMKIWADEVFLFRLQNWSVAGMMDFLEHGYTYKDRSPTPD